MIVENPVPITEEELRKLATDVKGKIKKIFLHWTEKHYGQVDDRYHLCVDQDGQVFVNCKTLLAVKPHTWLRNGHSVAVALCCCADAACWVPAFRNPKELEAAYAYCRNDHPECALVNYGPEPPTPLQIEMMANVVAVLADALGIAIGKDTVVTHCEVAFKDGYGPGEEDPAMAAWDLWFLPDTLRPGEVVPGGDLVRSKARKYLKQLRKSADASVAPVQTDPDHGSDAQLQNSAAKATAKTKSKTKTNQPAIPSV